MMHNNYLMHHGVKGMKWGVRRDPNRSIRGNLHRIAAANYGLNERTYRRLGNNKLESMNKSARTNSLKKAEQFDKQKRQKREAKRKADIQKWGKVSDKKSYKNAGEFFKKAGKNAAQNYKQGANFYSKSVKSIAKGKPREIGKHYVDWLNQDVEVLGFTGSKTMKRKRYVAGKYNSLY